MERINRTTTGCASCDYYFNGECTYPLQCMGHSIKIKFVPKVDEYDKAKLALAKDYIAKALKLLEEIENGKLD